MFKTYESNTDYYGANFATNEVKYLLGSFQNHCRALYDSSSNPVVNEDNAYYEELVAGALRELYKGPNVGGSILDYAGIDYIFRDKPRNIHEFYVKLMQRLVVNLI